MARLRQQSIQSAFSPRTSRAQRWELKHRHAKALLRAIELDRQAAETWAEENRLVAEANAAREHDRALKEHRLATLAKLHSGKALVCVDLTGEGSCSSE